MRRIALALVILLTPLAASAQPVQVTGSVQTPGGLPLLPEPYVAFNQSCNGGLGGIAGQTYGGVLCVADPGNGPFVSNLAMTAGTTYTPGRSIWLNCTAAGTEILALSGGTSLTVTVAVGSQSEPFAVKSYTAGTATCAVFELY
ncbi:MAG: hypothetical protein ACYDD1_04730 [Caulobacteraceae bacterium]